MEKVAKCGESQFVLIARYNLAGEVKKNELGGTCGTHEGREKTVQGLGGKS
jgi:hypothetical protein